ncbi:MAG: peptidoglycan bridge formation glycyltransferase FemA/FemB family protein [Anaerolineales bacterium]|nr:peptidoglycan bridge formation glycyltransferase FemA/FemB family protein [Anaerolineales bacterium]
MADPAAWDAAVAALPGAHLLQSWAWGDFKARTGWRARRWLWPGEHSAAAQVLTRALGRVLKVLYVPKGPLLDWADAAARAAVLDALQALARRERAIFIKVDPDVVTSRGGPGEEQPQPTGLAVRADLAARGWVFSRDQIQFRNTVQLDLRPTLEALLAGMKQKTRYNLRLAERKGVAVRPGSATDLPLLYQLYAETAARDGFVIRPAAYYQEAWGRFLAAGQAQPFLAEVGGEPVSALIVFRFAQTALYMYGMSREAHRDKMSNHLLQWHAIRWAKAQGCTVYDFWGAPDEFVESDRLWGVWKFKEGFGGQVVRTLGAWDYAPAPRLYRLYTSVLPRLLNVLHRRAAARQPGD